MHTGTEDPHNFWPPPGELAERSRIEISPDLKGRTDTL